MRRGAGTRLAEANNQSHEIDLYSFSLCMALSVMHCQRMTAIVLKKTGQMPAGT
jgi:hypothetical protein